MSKKKKNEKDREAPVLTGHDERAYKRSASRREWDEREADAPDGVSGSWS